MSEAATRIQAGEERSGAACGWCKEPLSADDMAAICADCAAVHHERCWDHELGCSKADCLNAPLKRLDAPAPLKIGDAASVGAPAPAPAQEGRPAVKKARRPGALNTRPCITCGQLLLDVDQVCDNCFTINTRDGLYHGPKRRAPGVGEALVMSLVGLLICGPVLGPMAISRASKAREAIRRDPRLEGDGMALAAMVIGIIDLAVWVLVLIGRLGGRGL